jgi:hypothetical protein
MNIPKPFLFCVVVALLGCRAELFAVVPDSTATQPVQQPVQASVNASSVAQLRQHDSSAARYGLVCNIGAGLTISGALDRVYPAVGETRAGGLLGLLRLTVTNGQLLSLGVETGWQHILVHRSSGVPVQTPTPTSGIRDTTLVTDIRSWLAGVPILLVLGAELHGFQIHAGLGYYSLLARSELFGSSVTSVGFDWAGSLSVGYMFTFSSGLRLGIEARACRLIDNQRGLISVQARCALPPIQF